MQDKNKENLGFAVGIKLHEEDIIKPRIIVRDMNMPRDIVINQLRKLVKMLEEEDYSNFKKNITKIGIDPE